MRFYEEKDLALCGLACVLCSKEECPGCKALGCAQANGCSVRKCVINNGFDGCYECGKFPCEENMLKGTRNRAFNRYASLYGKQALLDRLRINSENGITYHRPDGLKGDYDTLETETDIIRLIGFGIHDPYIKCPILETKHFTLRLVTVDDAGNLLHCYSDPKSQEIFDISTCTSDFHYQTIEEMQECILFWLKNYENHEFIRFNIVNKASGLGVGTVEMLGAAKPLTGWGVLRIDLASAYETEEYLTELLEMSNATYYTLMGVNRVITKAIPSAAERYIALRNAGFVPFEWPKPEREHYWARDIY